VAIVYDDTLTISGKIALDRIKANIVMLIVLLDLPAAFDTVDNNVLLSVLKHRFRMSDKYLNDFNPIWDKAA